VCRRRSGGTSRPRHGLLIKDRTEDYYESEIQHGRLYPNLDTLAEKGLIEKEQKDQRTNEYVVSRRGRREIEARQEWERSQIEEDAEATEAEAAVP